MMRRLGLLVGSIAVMLVTGAAPSWASSWFVDPHAGSGTACTVTSPCASLNQALANSASGDTINILSPGNFGPIYLTGSISITGPDDDATISWSNTQPGCIGSLPGAGCNGGSNATVAVQVAAGATTDIIKLKNLIISNGAGSNGAVQVDTAFGVSMSSVVLRGGTAAATAPQMMNVTSSQGSQLQLFFNHCDIAFSANGGGVNIAPTGTTPMRVHFANSEVHNAKYGLAISTAGLSGSADIAVAIDATEFFSFNNSSVSVAATGANQARVSIARSTILNTGGAALKFNGSNAFGALYENVITGNQTGVNVVGGAPVATFSNNQIFGNGVNCAVAGVTTACSSALSAQSEN